MLVQMELSRIFIREMTDMQIIELSEVDGERTFPIVIGLPEAFAIERRLKGIKIERPQTHDLLASVIEQLGGTLQRVVVNDLRDGTFFAKLVVKQNGQEVEIDSRPSDAIALAVAESVDVFVDSEVLDQTGSDAAAMHDFSSAFEEFEDDDDDDDEEDEDDDLDWS